MAKQVAASDSGPMGLPRRATPVREGYPLRES
jgi:hypothetical protein